MHRVKEIYQQRYGAELDHRRYGCNRMRGLVPILFEDLAKVCLRQQSILSDEMLHGLCLDPFFCWNGRFQRTVVQAMHACKFHLTCTTTGHANYTSSHLHYYRAGCFRLWLEGKKQVLIPPSSGKVYKSAVTLLRAGGVHTAPSHCAHPLGGHGLQ